MIPRRLIQKPKLRGKPSKSDHQRHRLYSMERTFIGWVVGTETNAQTLVAVRDHACREWGIPRPKITEETRKRVYGSCTDEEISLNVSYDGHNMSVFLHELAHWIQFHKYPDTEDHGPCFVGIYRYLLDRYKMMPAYAFDACCEHWGVKVSKVVPDGISN